MAKKVAFHTLGCKLNFSETSTIGKQFLDNGFEVVDFNDPADVYVVNTCTVTEGADRECRQIVRRALRNNPNAFITVTGCYTQLRSDEVAKIDGVDLILGSNDKFDIFNKVVNFQKNDNPSIYITPLDEMNEFYSAFSTDADSRTRAFLKIQDGCDYTCTYCTIPMARGKSRSSSPGNIISNFNELLEQGYKELILTGVNVGVYGQDIGTDLYSLLLQLIKIPKEFRIRISSIEPNLLTDGILELTANEEKMCNHFHIPLQSGSSDVLKLMQRRYNVKKFETLVDKINNRIPGLGIGIDVIVGFPGETDEKFQETFELLERIDCSYLHVFTYSERPNTKAINMENAVDPIVRKERNNALRRLSDHKLRKFYNSMIGRELEVLFEHKNIDGHMRGFASNYVRVQKDYHINFVNKLTKFKVVDFRDNLCIVE